MISENGEGTFANSSVPTHYAGNEQLRKYLERALLVREAKGRLYSHVLTDIYGPETWADEPVGPRKGHFEYLRARQTILIFQTGPTGSPLPLSSPNRRGQQTLVMGMTAWEYCWLADSTLHSRSYIQYVDTTGLYRPRRGQGTITRAVISAYLRYARDVLGVSSIHWYAAARPSLLFGGSEELPRKKVLDSVSLLNWWISLIQSLMERERESGAGSCDGYFYLPAEESVPAVAQCARVNLSQLNRLNGSKCIPLRWHYGPALGDGAGGGWDADQSNIPLFEDDPKWRHIEVFTEYIRSGTTPVGSNCYEERQNKRQKREPGHHSTVREFYQTLPYRTEFRQDPCSALMAVKFTVMEGRRSPYFGGRRGELAAFASKLLKTLSFATESETLKSSLRLWSWLKLMGSNPFEISVYQAEMGQLDDGDDRCFSEILRGLARPHDPEAMFDSNSSMYHDIQALVKRKLAGTIAGDSSPSHP